jgi:hypothetical protein
MFIESTVVAFVFQYRHAFLKQQEEVQSLRELISLKDNRIRVLEDELRLVKVQYEPKENELKR